MTVSVLVLSCLLSTQQAGPTIQTPARDTSALPSKAAGVIRGRVTSADGQPLHRVRITLEGASIPNLPSGVTDTRGDYEITNVPNGSYLLTAARAGYLTIQYGQRRPREAGRRVEVRDGQVVDRINLSLRRGGVLAGRVADDMGEAYAGVRVEAVEYRYLRGRRMLLQAAAATSNDIGEFRISGLPPGTYFLRASTPDTWESDDGKNTFAYVATYYPGVTAADQAQSMSVSVAQEVASLDFALRPGRTARVHGVLQNSNGEPIASQMVSVSRATRGVGGALLSVGPGASARTDRNGAFELRNLPPGEYVLNSGAESERISVPVTVADGEVLNVSLTPRKPSGLVGSIITDEDGPPPFPAALLRITPIATGPESALPSFTAPGAATVGRDWAFRINNIDGPYLFRVTGLPSEWIVSAVRLDNRDVTDVPLNVPGGGAQTSGLQIVLTRKGAKVEGQVVGRNGEPMPDSTVIVFADNSSRWTVASRFVRAARPDDEGRFSVAGLPAGQYRAIARDFVAEGQWEDPDFLSTLVGDALRFELAESGSATLTLKLEQPR